MIRPPLNEIFKCKDNKSKDKAMYEAHPPVRLYPKRYSRIYWHTLYYSEHSY